VAVALALADASRGRLGRRDLGPSYQSDAFGVRALTLQEPARGS
jgi:hypothetical protein